MRRKERARTGRWSRIERGGRCCTRVVPTLHSISFINRRRSHGEKLIATQARHYRRLALD